MNYYISSTQGLTQNFIKGLALYEIETYAVASISMYSTHFKGCIDLYVCSVHSNTFLYLYHNVFILTSGTNMFVLQEINFIKFHFKYTSVTSLQDPII